MTTATRPDHTASRRIKASPQAIYAVFLDPESLRQWLPPEGATMSIDIFEAHIGGRFRMVLTFASAPGKSSQNTDIVEGWFVDLVPARSIVQSVDFVSDDPAFSGTMTMRWDLQDVPGGTDVTVAASNVPIGISQGDHEAGLSSTLDNLAAFME